MVLKSLCNEEGELHGGRGLRNITFLCNQQPCDNHASLSTTDIGSRTTTCLVTCIQSLTWKCQIIFQKMVCHLALASLSK